MNDNYRVLIADDHPLARDAIRSVLEGDSRFEIIGEAENGYEAFQLCERLLPDLILMDISMPVWNGLEATRQIKRLYPDIQIVILSVSDNVTDLFTAIQFGAQGYLLKNLDPDDWIAYLRTLLDPDAQVSPEMAGRMFHKFNAPAAQDEPMPDVLTSRELEILACISNGLTNREIAGRLFISENTVKNHLKNILEKLDLDNRVQLASYAVRHGIKI